MAFDFLVPVGEKVITFSENLSPQTLGSNINKHTAVHGLPSFADSKIAIFGVLETRNASEKRTEKLDIDAIRMEFYQLMLGNWDPKIIDIGDVEEGNSAEDTYYVVKQISADLLKKEIVPLIIGATQDITFATFQAFKGVASMINLVSIDSRFDFGEENELISSQSYMSKIITDKPNNLYNFSNIGYQTYLNAQEEIDLMERLFFDAYRLGEISSDITLAEPILRDANLVSLDMRAIKGSEIGVSDLFSPNGFDSREICALARYSGIGEKIQLFGIYEIENTSLSFKLVAQIMWYFIEGLNFRIEETPRSNDDNFTKFVVPIDGETLVFFVSHITNRWWVEVPAFSAIHTKNNSVALLPCTRQDYLEACGQNIPTRWFKAYKKSIN